GPSEPARASSSWALEIPSARLSRKSSRVENASAGSAMRTRPIGGARAHRKWRELRAPAYRLNDNSTSRHPENSPPAHSSASAAVPTMPAPGNSRRRSGVDPRRSAPPRAIPLAPELGVVLHVAVRDLVLAAMAQQGVFGGERRLVLESVG